MKFRDKKKEKETKESSENNDLEIVMGDGLEISSVGDCMNDLRPKDHEKKKKNIVIPKSKKSDD